MTPAYYHPKLWAIILLHLFSQALKAAHHPLSIPLRTQHYERHSDDNLWVVVSQCADSLGLKKFVTRNTLDTEASAWSEQRTWRKYNIVSIKTAQASRFKHADMGNDKATKQQFQPGSRMMLNAFVP